MRRISLLPFILIFAFASFYFSSCVEDETPGPNAVVKKWIKENMDIYYFWNEEMPRISSSSYPDPSAYFYALRHQDDRFSYITPDAQSLQNQIDGNELTMGYSPAFRRIKNTDQVIIVVEYVYEGSPAYQADLKRGDIIVAINNMDLNINNYRNLYGQNAYTISLGTYNSETGVVKNNITKSLSAVMVQKNPILHYEVIDYHNKKIGYLSYAEFISGDDDRWLNKLKDALTDIKNQGATELVVDLRYNPGGQMKIAGFLASAIAPKTVSDNQSVLVKINYNQLLQNYFITNQGLDSENLIVKFPSTTINLDMSRVVFLTGFGSASASELLINGLEPYMDVVQIGDTTVGKCFGSIIIKDEDDKPKHTYAIMPLIMKYANAEGVTDFFDGLIPDYLISDNLFDAKPFGSLEDPMLAAAVAFLNDEEMPARLKPSIDPYIKLYDVERLRRGSIFWQQGVVID